MGVASELKAVAQNKKLANRCACKHHEDQYQPIVGMAVRKAVVVAQHRKEHRQREVGVVNAALLTALAVHGVDC